MNQALEPLYAEINTFLRQVDCRQTKSDRGVDCGLLFWRDHPSITAVEITMLEALARCPAGAEAAARLLGRDRTGTQDFLDALVAIGLLEQSGPLYGATAATRRYLEAFYDG